MSLINGELSYTPHQNYVGNDFFTLQVSDGALTDRVEISVIIEAVNDAPVTTNDFYEVTEGALLSVDDSKSILVNDFDVDDTTANLTIELVTQPSRASVFSMLADGRFEYQHDGSEFLNDSFSYRLSDGQVESNVSQVDIQINPINDAPIFISALELDAIEQGSVFEYFVGVSDPDSVDLQLEYQGPDWLSLDGFNINGLVPSDISGDISFTVNVRDNEGATAQQQSTFEVLQRETAEVHLAANWSNAPAFVAQEATLNLRLQSFSDTSVSGTLLLEFSEGTQIVSAQNCSENALNLSCELIIPSNETVEVNVVITAEQVQDTLVSAELIDINDNRLANVNSDISFIRQAVTQGNASFDISNATALTTADLHERQGIEIIAGTEQGDTVKILRLDGEAGQSELLASLNNTGQTETIIANDFNLDGRTDVLVINSQGQVSDVYYATREGLFESSTQTIALNFGKKAFIQDFNQDGYPDLVMSGQGYNLSVYINVDGYFSEAPDVYTANHPITSIANLIADNKIAVATGQSLQILFYQIQQTISARPTLDGSLAAKISKASFVPASEPLEIVGITDIAVADLDGDNSQEIVVTARSTTTSTVNNDGKAKRSVSVVSTTANKLETVGRFGSASSNKVQIADFDGDNKPDLMIGNDTGVVQIYKNKGQLNQFELQESVIVSNSSVIAPVDLNGDGLADIVSYDKTQGKMALFTSNSNGNLGQQADLVLKAQTQLMVLEENTNHQVLYKLLIENSAQVDSLENKVTINVPDDIDVKSMPVYCVNETTKVIVCSIGTVLAGSEITIPLVLSGNLLNSKINASHKASLADTNTGNNFVESEFSKYGGNLSVSAVAEIVNNNEKIFSYSAIVKNNSALSTTNNQITVSFPEGLGYLDVPQNCIRQVSTSLVVFVCDLGTLANGVKATTRFRLQKYAGVAMQSDLISVAAKADIMDVDTNDNQAQTSIDSLFTASGRSESSGGSIHYLLLILILLISLQYQFRKYQIRKRKTVI
ncbi:FG-GAP-like repeat-containing protein [Catenovulum sediminis]|uniref:FG-GAP-like repeat-containing protein n=1 Tax=Catenovulum sediminis TaxID=1740262 RepID=UPI00117EC184|nr:FG-GAP-like repeat-containing protein [Catenovulum sediminis]